MKTVHDIVDDMDKKWSEEAIANGKKVMTKPELQIIEQLGGLAVCVHAFHDAIASQGPEHIADNARKMFRTKQKLDEMFPPVPVEMSPNGLCPVCSCEERKEGSTCPHAGLVRAAILLMALLKMFPEPDLDVLHGEPAEAL
jgi:hypothetical protein